jgi:hypothetical protein
MKTLKYFALITILFNLIISCSNDDSDELEDNSSNNLKQGQIEIKVYPNDKNTVSFSATTDKITIDWGDGNIDNLISNGVHQTFSHEYTNQNLQIIKIDSKDLTEFSTPSSSKRGNFKELYFGEMNKLEYLYCAYNFLTVLQIKKASMLKELHCKDNVLTSLDISESKALTYIDCRENKLTSLDISGCNFLEWFNCSFNQFTSLNVNNCNSLTWLNCIGNPLLTAEALNSLFESLPPNNGYVYCEVEKNECEMVNKEIAENKGWIVNLYYW